ncbi:MAG TPA: hypothetical protein VN782_02070 [Usitatibacter sp.]|nr:hypothetical protein [Usitatibacter sp.]
MADDMPDADPADERDAGRSTDKAERELRRALAGFCLFLVAGAIILTLIALYAGWDERIVPVTLAVAAIALVFARIAIR